MRTILIAASVALCCATAWAGEMARFYVAPDGDDTWTGTYARPFRTLTRARDAVRAVKAAQSGDLVVYLRGGVHYVPTTVLLDQHDSGINGHKVVYRNAPGETPVLVGGLPVTEWRRSGTRIYRADIPGLREGLVRVTQVFENGVRAWPARHPNHVGSVEQSWLVAEARTRQSLTHRPDDLQPKGWDLSAARVRFYEPYYWYQSLMPVTSVDEGTRRIDFLWPGFYPEDAAPFYYAIEGVRELLDSPGEYYADPKTGGLLYYPRDPDIRGQEVIYATTECILRLEAYSPAKPIHDVVIEGLEFAVSHTTELYRWAWPERGELGDPDTSNDRYATLASNDWALVEMQNAQGITIRDCVFRDSGMSGLSLTQWCQDNTVTDCEFANMGYYGISIHGDIGAGGVGHNRRTLIHNNHIHDVGEVMAYGSGIGAFNSAENTITHNLITDCTRNGIFVAGQWDVPPGEAFIDCNRIAHNVVARCMSATSDGGSIYLAATNTLEDASNIIENNLVLDSFSWTPGWEPSGIYTDLQADHTIVRNNIVDCIQGAVVVGAGSRIEENNSWNEGFDRGRVADDLGLTAEYRRPFTRVTYTPPEPPRPVPLPFACRFEGDIAPLAVLKTSRPGPFPFSETVVHSGRMALINDRKLLAFTYTHDAPLRGLVRIYLYDDPSKRHADFMILLRRPPSEDNAGLGVLCSRSADTYCYRVGMEEIPTEVARTEGWHELSFDLRSPECVIYLIDGREVHRSRWMDLDTIQGGDLWGVGDSVGLGFDDLLVTAQ